MIKVIGFWLLAAIFCTMALAQNEFDLRMTAPKIKDITAPLASLGLKDAVVTATGTAKATYKLLSGQVWMGALGNDIGEPDMVEVLFKSEDYVQRPKAGQGGGRAVGQMPKLVGKMRVSMPQAGVVRRSGARSGIKRAGTIIAKIKIMKVNDDPLQPDEEVASGEWADPQLDQDGWFEIKTQERQPAGSYYLLGGFRLSAENNTMVALRGGSQTLSLVRVSNLSAPSAED